MRVTIGVLALLFIGAGAVFWNDPRQMISGVSLRVGMVLAVWWLAYPQLRRVPPWFGVAAGVMLLLVLVRPKLLLVALPVLLVLWLLRPRRKPAGNRES